MRSMRTCHSWKNCLIKGCSSNLFICSSCNPRMASNPPSRLGRTRQHLSRALVTVVNFLGLPWKGIENYRSVVFALCFYVSFSVTQSSRFSQFCYFSSVFLMSNFNTLVIENNEYSFQKTEIFGLRCHFIVIKIY